SKRDWSSDVCSSDLDIRGAAVERVDDERFEAGGPAHRRRCRRRRERGNDEPEDGPLAARLRRDVEGLVVSVGSVDELDGGLLPQALPLLGVENLIDERGEHRRRQRRHAESSRGATHEQGWHFARRQYEPARLL